MVIAINYQGWDNAGEESYINIKHKLFTRFF